MTGDTLASSQHLLALQMRVGSEQVTVGPCSLMCTAQGQEQAGRPGQSFPR